jgi:hypothetical protein
MARSARSRPAPAEADPRFTDVLEAFAGEPNVSAVPGWGRGNSTLRAGEKIFALLTPSGLVAKLPRARVDALVAAREGTRFDPRKNGRVMKEWLVSPDEGAWIALAREAYGYVGVTLPRDGLRRAPRSARQTSGSGSRKSLARPAPGGRVGGGVACVR